MELIQMAGAAWLSKSIAVAARLGVADILESGPKSCEEIAAAADCHDESLQRMMRVLATFGVFAATEDGRFGNSPVSEQLRTAHPMSMRYFCMLSGEEYYDAWGGLLHTMKTGESAFPKVFGGSVYDLMDRNPETARVYDHAMQDLARPVGMLLARDYDFRNLRKVVDVGGGSGIVTRQVLKFHPHLEGVVLDREDVCTRAAASVNGEFKGRLTFQSGDFFAEVPADGDLYILKNVLHNWNEEHCARILGSIRRAMQPEAKLLVIEPLVEPEDVSPRKLMNALFQIVICQDGTRDRTQAEMRTMLAGSGFDVTNIKVLPTGHAVVEATPAVN